MKKSITVILLCIGMYAIASRHPDIFPTSSINEFFHFGTAAPSSNENVLKNAFEQKISGIQVSGSGRVIKILSDDKEGSRHQRFILKQNSGQTLLVAHNIDLAPRIETLKVDDQVIFYGEYEWNKMGGVIHWTHHDPNGQHEGGWIKHDGKKYQ